MGVIKLSKECPDCKEHMIFTLIKPKCKVLNENPNLNSNNEIKGWKCPQCKQVLREELEKCTCGNETLKWKDCFPEPNSFNYFPVKLILEYKHYDGSMADYSFGCTSCVSCIVCKKTIASHEYEIITKYMSSNWKFEWEVYSYCHSNCYHAYQRIKQEENDRLEREIASRFADRVKNGLCTKCGQSLSLSDKFWGRQAHKKCS